MSYYSKWFTNLDILLNSVTRFFVGKCSCSVLLSVKWTQLYAGNCVHLRQLNVNVIFG